MKKYYIYNGTPVEFDGKQRDLDKFEARNEHLIGNECTKQEYENQITIIVPGYVRTLEENSAYIDAIMLQMNYDRLNGRDLIQDLDDALGVWLSHR